MLFWIGYALRALGGLWGFAVGFMVAAHLFGGLGVVLAFILFPVAITLGPLYAAFAYGAWLHVIGPMVLGVGGLVMMGIGAEQEERRSA